MKGKVGLIVSLIALAIFIGLAGVALYHDLQPDPKPTIAELLQEVNKERKKVGVKPLTLDSRLNTSAQMKADDMFKRNYFDHIAPDGKAGNEYIFEKLPYTCNLTNENIAMNALNTNTSVNTVQDWVRSNPHYTEMVNPRYDITGFGIAGTKVVQHFCEKR